MKPYDGLDIYKVFSGIVLFFILLFISILLIAYYKSWNGRKLILRKTYFKAIITHIILSMFLFLIRMLCITKGKINLNGITLGIMSFFCFIIMPFLFKNRLLKEKINDILVKFKFIRLIRGDKTYKSFIISYYIALMVLDALNGYLIFYFLLLILYSIFEIVLICMPVDEKINLEVSYISLDYIDIIEHPIYFDDIDDEKDEEDDKRIFKIKIDSNEKDISNLKIHVLNHQYYPAAKIKENIDTSYIYFVIKNTMNTLSKLKLVLEYDEHGKRKKYRCNVYLNLFRYQTEITIYDPVIETLHYALFFKQPSKFLRKSPSKKQYVKELSLFLNNAYYYEDDIMLGENTELFRKQEIRDIRKWILHDGKFGVGKSVLDFSFLSAQGYKTIVISPWEENYDNDFLYLIYSKIKDNTKGLNKLDKSVSIFEIAMIIALYTLINQIIHLLTILSNHIHEIIKLYFVEALNKNDVYKNLINLLNDYGVINFLINSKDIILICGSVFIAYIITKYLLPYAIVHSKNTTKIHQSYYVQSINNLIQKDNIMLVIEDIDRLEESACKDLFRTLSLINSRFPYRKKPLGILSYDCNNDNIKGIESDLNNKAIYDCIFKNISLEKSMKTYFKNYMTAIENVIDKSIEEKDEMINKIANDRNLNFRDVHLELDKIVHHLLDEI